MPQQDPALRHAAALARLQPDDAERARLERDLKAILRMVERLQAAPVAEVQPLYHPLELPAPLRADQVTEGDQRALHLALAPSTGAGYYLVPRVLD